MNKAEFTAEHGHRYSRCFTLETHEPHLWTRRSDAPRVLPWWCGGDPNFNAIPPMDEASFLNCYPEVGHRRICDRIESHPEHNWSSPQGRFWCSQPDKEPAMNEPYDQTIRPLLCGKNKGVHGPHNWETPPNRTWACPGRDVPCVCEPSSKLGLDNPGLHTLDCPSYRGPERRACGNNEQHEPHAWRKNTRRWGCPGIVRPKNYLEEAAKMSAILPDREHGVPVHRNLLINQRIDEEPNVVGTVYPKPPTEPRECSNYEPHEPHDWPVSSAHPSFSCDGRPKSTEVAKWADKAMFSAEPIDAQEGPRVYLLWMTPDPLGAIAAACKMYKGEVVRDLSTVTDAERLDYLAQIQKTKLKAPFEFVKFHFMIEGVTRAFTHQMVRQRTAVYAQESLRFAVKEDLPVGLPPSLAGTWDGTGPNESGMSHEDQMRTVWDKTLDKVSDAYSTLVDMGMPAEDARGLLPTNILTRLHYSTDLRALLDHAGNRLCTQAQFEWRLVFAQIVNAIRNVGGATFDNADGRTRVYFADTLTDLFKPVCYQTGRCEFKANFDRACSIRDRVDANEQIGRPSDRWHKDFLAPDYTVEIPGIKPGEWLLDPGAARKKG